MARERKGNLIYAENDLEKWCKWLNKDFSDDRKKKILDGFKKQKKYDSLGDYLYYDVEYSDVIKWQTDSFRKAFKKAMDDLRDEFEKEEVKSQDDMMVEREESSTNMDEYAEFEEVPAENKVSVPFVEVDENTDKEPLPISEIDKIIAS